MTGPRGRIKRSFSGILYIIFVLTLEGEIRVFDGYEDVTHEYVHVTDFSDEPEAQALNDWGPLAVPRSVKDIQNWWENQTWQTE